MHTTNHVTPQNTFRKGQALERYEANRKKTIEDRPAALQVVTKPPSFQSLLDEMQRATTIQEDAAVAAGLADHAADVTYLGDGAEEDQSELPEAPVVAATAIVKRRVSTSPPAAPHSCPAKRTKTQRGSPPAGARFAGAAVKKEPDKDGLLLALEAGVELG